MAESEKALWKAECDKWSAKEWAAFLDTLCEKKEDGYSFRQWIFHLGEQKLCDYLEEWKEKAERLKCRVESEKSYLPESLPEEMFPRLNHYTSWCSSEREFSLWTHQYMVKMAKIKKPVQEEWLIIGQVQELCELSSRIYQYLEERVDNMPKYDSSILKAELDAWVEQWNTWRKEYRRIVEDLDMLIYAIYNHDVLSCWNHNFTYKPNHHMKKMDNREHLALLACAPIAECYQKNCEAFLQMVEVGGEGCSPGEVLQYVEAIFEYIYMPLVERVKKSELKEAALDEAAEYYFRLLEKLSEKLPETSKAIFVERLSAI